MSEIEPVTVYSQEWSDDGNFSIRAESYYPDEVLDEMARRVGNELDEEIIRRLGYVKPVRCRDCDLSQKDGTRCLLFAGWEPIEGGDEYELVSAEVEPDGFCAWCKPRSDHGKQTGGSCLG